MSNIIRTRGFRVLCIALQIGALWLLREMAAAIAALSPVPLPAGVVGLVLLFGLLCAGAVKVQWIEGGAELLVRHLGLFLIPYAVSFMAFGELIAASGIAIALVVIVSTMLGIAAAGAVAQAVQRAARRPLAESPQR